MQPLPSRSGTPAGVSVDPDGLITGVDGTRYRLLHLPGLMLDARTLPEQDHVAYLLGTLAAGLPHKARLSIVVENRPADAAALVAQLRAQVAPEPYTAALGELGERLLEWWRRRLCAPGQRHVPLLDYWLLVSPYPVQDGYPDQSAEARLVQATETLTRQCVAMGVPPLVASAEMASHFLERHLARTADNDSCILGPLAAAYVAPTGEEAMHTYRTGARWIRALYLVQPPAFTEPGWLRALIAPDCPATVVLHVVGLRRSWERRRQGWRLRLIALQLRVAQVA